MAFSRAEHAERLAAVRARMAARDVHALIVEEVEHLAYLAGWHASGSLYHACVVPLDADPIMVCRRLDEPAFRERSWLAEAVFFGDAEGPVGVQRDGPGRGAGPRAPHPARTAALRALSGPRRPPPARGVHASVPRPRRLAAVLLTEHRSRRASAGRRSRTKEERR